MTLTLAADRRRSRRSRRPYSRTPASAATSHRAPLGSGADRAAHEAARGRPTVVRRSRRLPPGGVLADQQGDDVPQLDLTHRRHARVEDHIREGKDCGLRNLRFQSFAHNQVRLWLVMLAHDLIAWTAQLCLADAARAWELKRLRYRLLHQSARIARHARHTIMRLARDWPWADQLATAFARLQALPPPA